MPPGSSAKGLTPIDPAKLELWQRRWALLAEVEREELLKLTLEEKLARLEGLFLDAQAFGWTRASTPDQERLSTPWARLRARRG